jgi:hypothetical protein
MRSVHGRGFQRSGGMREARLALDAPSPDKTIHPRERSLGLSGLLALRGVAAQDFALGR